MKPLPDFLEPLDFVTSEFPWDAVEAVLARKEEALPHFLDHLDRVARRESEIDDLFFTLHEFAIRFCVLWKETRAFAPLIRMVRDLEIYDFLAEDTTSRMGSFLAELWDGDWQVLKDLIEDQNVSKEARDTGLCTLACLVVQEKIDRQAFSGYLGELFDRRLNRSLSAPWEALCQICSDLRLKEHVVRIRQVFADGLWDVTFIPEEDFEDLLESFEEEDFGQPLTIGWTHYVLDVDLFKEMATWDVYTEEINWDEDDFVEPYMDEPLDDLFEDGRFVPFPSSFEGATAATKVGRNDPCPCGSGKKYKKCCGKNQAT